MAGSAKSSTFQCADIVQETVRPAAVSRRMNALRE
jgi:hypothetical protein